MIADVVAGDKVVFICPNILPLLEARYAVPLIGAVWACEHPAQKPGAPLYHQSFCGQGSFIDSEYISQLESVVGALDQVTFFVNICEHSCSSLLNSPEWESCLVPGRRYYLLHRNRGHQQSASRCVCACCGLYAGPGLGRGYKGIRGTHIRQKTDRIRDYRLLSRTPCTVQGAENWRILSAAENSHRKDHQVATPTPE